MSGTRSKIWDEAIAEALAMAPTNQIILYTLEINHPSFTEPVRVCNWPVAGSEPEKFMCLLEEDAPYNPGEVVEFLGLPFEYLLPEKDMENPGYFSIKVDNVGDRLDQHLWDAALGGGTITAIYRSFVKGDEREGPNETWPYITIKNPRLEGQTLIFDGAIMEWMHKPYGKLYYPSDYPALRV